MSTVTVYLALSLIYNYTFYCTTMVNSGGVGNEWAFAIVLCNS
jgi:hypothetical protein